jgi:hypothetical protein
VSGSRACYRTSNRNRGRRRISLLFVQRIEHPSSKSRSPRGADGGETDTERHAVDLRAGARSQRPAAEFEREKPARKRGQHAPLRRLSREPTVVGPRERLRQGSPEPEIAAIGPFAHDARPGARRPHTRCRAERQFRADRQAAHTPYRDDSVVRLLVPDQPAARRPTSACRPGSCAHRACRTTSRSRRTLSADPHGGGPEIPRVR